MVSARERAGRYVRQPAEYRAFVPAPLPPDPPIDLARVGPAMLSRADQAIGRLDGVTHTMPNPDLFVAMYVRREAVLSSQIEGTQSTLEDVLQYELDPKGRQLPSDVEEVVNYVRAMKHGLRRLETLPLSLRLIREVHGELMEGVRGQVRSPGEFRTSQNWIGGANTPLSQAAYVPPAVPDMHAALDSFEKFLHEDSDLPLLIRCGLAHAQTETIHPFLDGNGRVGRLLITLLLVHGGALHRPLLYLSHYLKRRRSEYYDRLTAIREAGDWEGWLRFFVRGVAETAEEATRTARAIVDLRERDQAVMVEGGLGANGVRVLTLLFQQPIVNPSLVTETLGVSPTTAGKLLGRLTDMGIIEEVTGGRRNRRYRYTPYLALFEDEDNRPVAEGVSIQTTESEPIP